MKDAVIIDIACSSEGEARRIARLLLEDGLASAAQIHPIESLYWWEGSIHEEAEWLIHLISRKDLFSEIKELVFGEHSYQLPEVVAYPIEALTKEYALWIQEYTKKESDDRKA